jgi:hypothetical protein
MAELDVDAFVDREVLLFAVQRAITCPRSGVVLDVRTAVYYRVTNFAGKTGSDVVDGAVWDEIEQRTRAVCAARGITLEVIDGREAWK